RSTQVARTAERRTLRLRVELNGTDRNPYHKLGLTQNPFPQIAEHRYSGACLRLQSLGGEPCDPAKIRRVLAGWEPAFVEELCRRWRPGEIVKFEVTFPV